MKLTDDDARRALERFRENESVKQIAEDFGVSYHVIYRICTGKTYKHLHEDRPSKIREVDEDRIVELVSDGYSSSAVARDAGLSTTAVSKIFKRKTGESISSFRKRKAVKYGQEVR